MKDVELKPYHLYTNPKSLIMRAIEVYVMETPIMPQDMCPSIYDYPHHKRFLKIKNRTLPPKPILPKQLEFVHDLLRVRNAKLLQKEEFFYPFNVQLYSLFYNDITILWKLYHIGFKYRYKYIDALDIETHSINFLKSIRQENKKERERIYDIQCAAVLFDDSSVISELNQKSNFDPDHLDLALNNYKNNSLKTLSQIKLKYGYNHPNRFRTRTMRSIEADAMKIGNIEGLKILIKYNAHTITRLYLRTCSQITEYQPNDATEKSYTDDEKLDILRFVRDNHKIDINWIFYDHDRYSSNIIALKGLDDPTEKYKYPRHIDFSPNMDYYEYFLSRGLVPSSRLFVFTKDYEIIETLLKNGLRPTKRDISQSYDINKLKLYRKYCVYVNLSNVLMKPTLDIKLIDDNFFGYSNYFEIRCSACHEFLNTTREYLRDTPGYNSDDEDDDD
jgi:hypothetical protein